jgi:hypothetical protein
MGNIRRLLPVLASGLLSGLTLAMTAELPQPSPEELQAIGEMNTVPVQRRRDHEAYLRYWLFGTACTSGAVRSEPVWIE